MVVVKFRERAEPAPSMPLTYKGVSNDTKRAANSAVAELFWAMNIARTQTPQAGKAFDRIAQSLVTNTETGAFGVWISRVETQGVLDPIITFYASPNDGWVCTYKKTVLRDRDITKLVAKAHQAISAEDGLELPSINALGKLNNRLAIG